MKKRIAIVLCALVVLFVVGSYAAQPGTEADPLVTRSYIESVLYPSLTFKVVNVPARKSVICSAGTEVILRMGTCSVIGTQKGGMSDVTMGYDLANATVVQGNHLLITPMDDGRGVWTATDCILLIKGRYEIK